MQPMKGADSVIFYLSLISNLRKFLSLTVSESLRCYGPLERENDLGERPQQFVVESTRVRRGESSEYKDDHRQTDIDSLARRE